MPLPVRDLPVRADRGQLLVVRQPDGAARLRHHAKHGAASRRRDHAPVPLEDPGEGTAVHEPDRDARPDAPEPALQLAAARPGGDPRGAVRLQAARRGGARLLSRPAATAGRRRGTAGGVPRVPHRGRLGIPLLPARAGPEELPRLPSVSGVDRRSAGRLRRGPPPPPGRGRPDGGGEGGDARCRHAEGDQLEPRHPAGDRHHHRLSGDARGLRDRAVRDREAARPSAARQRRGPPGQHRRPGRHPHRRRVRGTWSRLQSHAPRADRFPGRAAQDQHRARRQGRRAGPGQPQPLRDEPAQGGLPGHDEP